MILAALPELVAFLAPAQREINAQRLLVDSRCIGAGDAFIALNGASAHGAQYAEKALSQGAVAVIVDTEGLAKTLQNTLGQREQIILVPALRAKLGAVAAAFYGNSATRLHCVGVTGTNGKTSITQLLARALQQLRATRVGTIGTLGCGFPEALRSGERTTPDVLSLHAEMAVLESEGATGLVMEVSSHALVQERVGGMQFKGAIFSNLTRDHLDYHGSMQAYAEAKAKLFQWPGLKYAVMNVESQLSAEQMALFQPRSARYFKYSVSAESEADLRCLSVQARPRGFQLQLQHGSEQLDAHLPLLGSFNVSNALAVLSALICEGYALADLAPVLEKMQPVAGRMNVVDFADGPLVLVDYAHTPDALVQVLRSVRAHVAPDARLRCLFGCGGDRDSGKRPLMAQAVASHADELLITTDNPRTETPDAIVAQMLAGLEAAPYQHINARVVLDRKAAIEAIIADAAANDVIVIAGKGHEDYQEIQGVKYPFDDRVVAKAALQKYWQKGHADAA